MGGVYWAYPHTRYCGILSLPGFDPRAAGLQSNLKHRSHHLIVLLAATQAMYYAQMVFFKQPYHNSVLTGKIWVTELLGGNPRCIKDQLGIEKHVFLKFVRKLFIMTSANHSWHVDLAERVATFLYTMVTNLSKRKVGECFQRSGDTISKYEFSLSPSFPWLHVYQMLQSNPECCHIPSFLQDLH